MARVTTTGLDELITEMENMWEQAEPVFNEMLEIAADESEKAWKDAIEKHNLVQSGQMLASVKADLNKRAAGGLKIATTYPRGMDTRRVRNALKAFVNHYGSRRNKATYFVDDAEQEIADKVPDLLHKRWNEHLEGK